VNVLLFNHDAIKYDLRTSSLIQSYMYIRSYFFSIWPWVQGKELMLWVYQYYFI